MKRYWKIITLCITAIMVIGTFYIQTSLAAKDQTKIEFEKLSGDEDEIRNIVLYGDRMVGNLNQSLQISSEETIQTDNQSLLQELTENHINPTLKKLVEENKSFMRGKDLIGNNFYEDEKVLVYASKKRENSYESTNDITFDIDVLNKESEETLSFQLDVHGEEIYNWMDVLDVQEINGNIKVFTMGSRTDGGNDLNAYTIEIENKKLISNETITSAPTIKNGWSDIRLLNDYYSIQPQKYLLLKVETYQESKVEETNGEMVQNYSEPKLLDNEVIVYNIENNQSKKVTVPDHLIGSIDRSTLSNSMIYFQTQTESGFELISYDIEKEKWGNTFSFKVPDSNRGKDAPYTKLMNGKFYLVRAVDDGYAIFIGDLQTGKSLYEGKFKPANQKDAKENERLYIHEIEYIY